jgi:hypothetical protein
MYVSVTQTAKILAISAARVRKLVGQGRIRGAFKVGNVWVIPLVGGLPVISKGTRGPKLGFGKHRPTGVSRIHVNQNVIRSNKKTGERKPVITVKRHNSNTYAHEVVVNGPCRIVYEPDKGMPCCPKARVWIETYSQIEVINKDFSQNIEDVAFA